MRNNIEEVMKRGDNLEELGERSKALQEGALEFEQRSRQLKKKLWWKDKKVLRRLELCILRNNLIILIHSGRF